MALRGVTPEASKAMRAEVIRLLVAGMSQRDAARMTGLSTKRVGNLASEAREEGVLVPYRKGAPRTEKAHRLREEGLSINQIAEKLAVTAETIRELLRRRDRRMEGLPPEDFDIDDDTPGCKRCGLRGEHECLPARAEGFLRQQEDS